MSGKVLKSSISGLLPALLVLTTLSCGGGTSGNDNDNVVSGFNNRNIDLYTEVPPIYVMGNMYNGATLKFYPKGDTTAGLCDVDGDGTPETQINDFESFGNAANNIFNEQVAACVLHGATDRTIYDPANHPQIWTDDANNPALTDMPDTMPSSAGVGGTDDTQFIQVMLPFNVAPGSVYSASALPADDYLVGNITITDETGTHVPCTVLVNGVDALGNNTYTSSANWPDGAQDGANIITFIAQTAAGSTGMPLVSTAFTATGGAPEDWTRKEIYLRIASLRDTQNAFVSIQSKHVIRRSGVAVDDDDTMLTLAVTDITATDFIPDIGDPTGIKHDLWPGVSNPHDLCITPETSFLITFNKPVVPVTVGRSIVFNRAPFYGNSKPVPNPKALEWPYPSECTGSIYPMCPNIVLQARFLDSAGSTSGTQTPIPYRIYPLSQNNLATYIINPIIDLPGSSTEALSPPTGDDIRMRIDVQIYDYQTNNISADHDNDPINTVPENLGVSGFHGERFYASGNPTVTRTFSVLKGKRYVNAPVSPHVVYFSMGTSGIGAIDLDGNGFPTGTPGSGVFELVTCTLYYNVNGSVMNQTGNTYSYGARATPNYVGLGLETPVPGVNVGSQGLDTLVRDSNGSPQLFPDPEGSTDYMNISDIDVGDFLDTIYYDKTSSNVRKDLHTDLVFPAAIGNYLNNTIASPPVPNPPPLTIPVGMRPVDVILDDFSIMNEGAFVIMGKEVFTGDVISLSGGIVTIDLTGFVHLGIGGISPDYALPPNPPGTGSYAAVNFLNVGPCAESATYSTFFGIQFQYASRQQIGNFLFAADKTNNMVRVINSNSMEEITTLQAGLKGPDHCAVSPDLKKLYVSNGAGNSVAVYDVDPRSDTFLELLHIVYVGGQPKGVCCQPDFEDILVCNYGTNTISIIDAATNTVRKTLTSLIKKPWDIVAGPRQMQFGYGTQVYHGYVSNYGGDNVLIYESGPDGLGGVGYDNILDPVSTSGSGLIEYEKIYKPRGICYNPTYLNNQQSSLNLTGGCFVAHSSTKGAAVSEVMFTQQYAPWGPIFLVTPSGSIGGTPGFGDRVFEITSQWTVQDGNLSGVTSATDVAMPDFYKYAWLNSNFSANPYVTNYGSVGANPAMALPINNKHPIRIIMGTPVPTWTPVTLYVSYENTGNIDLIDINTGEVDTITGLPKPAKTLKTFFKN